ncbi:hypothetical protein DIPPA_02138 [Diplonema papillatum]|nr:hypothetical protein DIPPA_02138 [Diplonema papillatum]
MMNHEGEERVDMSRCVGSVAEATGFACFAIRDSRHFWVRTREGGSCISCMIDSLGSARKLNLVEVGTQGYALLHVLEADGVLQGVEQCRGLQELLADVAKAASRAGNEATLKALTDAMISIAQQRPSAVDRPSYMALWTQLLEAAVESAKQTNPPRTAKPTPKVSNVVAVLAALLTENPFVANVLCTTATKILQLLAEIVSVEAQPRAAVPSECGQGIALSETAKANIVFIFSCAVECAGDSDALSRVASRLLLWAVDVMQHAPGESPVFDRVIALLNACLRHPNLLGMIPLTDQPRVSVPKAVSRVLLRRCHHSQVALLHFLHALCTLSPAAAADLLNNTSLPDYVLECVSTADVKLAVLACELLNLLVGPQESLRAAGCGDAGAQETSPGPVLWVLRALDTLVDRALAAVTNRRGGSHFACAALRTISLLVECVVCSRLDGVAVRVRPPSAKKLAVLLQVAVLGTAGDAPEAPRALEPAGLLQIETGISAIALVLHLRESSVDPDQLARTVVAACAAAAGCAGGEEARRVPPPPSCLFPALAQFLDAVSDVALPALFGGAAELLDLRFLRAIFAEPGPEAGPLLSFSRNVLGSAVAGGCAAPRNVVDTLSAAGLLSLILRASSELRAASLPAAEECFELLLHGNPCVAAPWVQRTLPSLAAIEAFLFANNDRGVEVAGPDSFGRPSLQSDEKGGRGFQVSSLGTENPEADSFVAVALRAVYHDLYWSSPDSVAVFDPRRVVASLPSAVLSRIPSNFMLGEPADGLFRARVVRIYQILEGVFLVLALARSRFPVAFPERDIEALLCTLHMAYEFLGRAGSSASGDVDGRPHPPPEVVELALSLVGLSTNTHFLLCNLPRTGQVGSKYVEAIAAASLKHASLAEELLREATDFRRQQWDLVLMELSLACGEAALLAARVEPEFSAQQCAVKEGETLECKAEVPDRSLATADSVLSLFCEIRQCILRRSDRGDVPVLSGEDLIVTRLAANALERLRLHRLVLSGGGHHETRDELHCECDTTAGYCYRLVETVLHGIVSKASSTSAAQCTASRACSAGESENRRAFDHEDHPELLEAALCVLKHTNLPRGSNGAVLLAAFFHCPVLSEVVVCRYSNCRRLLLETLLRAFEDPTNSVALSKECQAVGWPSFVSLYHFLSVAHLFTTEDATTFLSLVAAAGRVNGSLCNFDADLYLRFATDSWARGPDQVRRSVVAATSSLPQEFLDNMRGHPALLWLLTQPDCIAKPLRELFLDFA